MSLPLEKQVVSLPLAQRLKELGVKQESFWGWVQLGERYVDGEFTHATAPELAEVNDGGQLDYPYVLVGAAFTVAELGEILPRKVWHKGNAANVYLTILKGDGDWYIEYYDCSFTADTEADSRAEMLVYLLENNLIPEPKVTK